jgi:tRNA (guanine6-N2)-methyltransferase
MHRVMVRTLRGLEAVARTEVQQRFGPVPVAIEHRTLRFALPRLDPRLLSLGTVDDAFVVLSETDGIGRGRSALDGLTRLARSFDASGALAIEALRALSRPIAFDVTASFIGRRDYSRFEVEDRVGTAMAGSTGWTYRPRGPLAPGEAPSLSFRVHALHTHATLAVRLAERPLHRRAYRVRSRPGALHPPLARALCVVAEPMPGGSLVDPTCGVGTIPIEAALADPRTNAAGFDLDADAVSAARCNTRRAGTAVRLAVADATRLPLADGSVDRLVVNPPWGEAVATAGVLRRRPAALWTEASRVLAPSGRLVALLPAGSHPCGARIDVDVVAHVRVHGAEAVIVAS